MNNVIKISDYLLGHTDSGKPVYPRCNHKRHFDFTNEDHLNASTLHRMKARGYWETDIEEARRHQHEAYLHLDAVLTSMDRLFLKGKNNGHS